MIEGRPAIVHREVEPVEPHDRLTRALGARVGARFELVDLRDAEPGDGFEWGRAGPSTEIVRAGDAPVWAIEKPKPGLLARLFGGGRARR